LVIDVYKIVMEILILVLWNVWKLFIYLLIQYAEEIEEEHRLNRPLLEPVSDSQTDLIGRIHEEYTDEGNEDLVLLELPQDSKEHWDCESVAYAYSYLYSRSKIIAEPIVIERTT
jgi:hypothetical protein